MTPFEAWNGNKPNVKNLRIFGSICFSHFPKDERKKLDVKAKKGIFFGYGTEVKGYRLFDISLRKPYYSRDVIFNEGCFLNRKLSEGNGNTFSNNQYSEDISNNINSEEDVVDDIVPTNTVTEEILCPDTNDFDKNKFDDFNGVTLRRSTRTNKVPNAYGEWMLLMIILLRIPIS